MATTPRQPPGSAASHLCLGPGWSSVANTPFRRHKTWVHEGGISTPLIAHWPRGIAARGELRHDPGHMIDLVPTILDAAGANRRRSIAGWTRRLKAPSLARPGKSLLPAFARDGSVSHDAIWWEHEGNRAIRVGDWKLVAAQRRPLGAVRPRRRPHRDPRPGRGSARAGPRDGGALAADARRVRRLRADRSAVSRGWARSDGMVRVSRGCCFSKLRDARGIARWRWPSRGHPGRGRGHGRR